MRDAQPRITSLRVRLSRNSPPLCARARAQAPNQRNDSSTSRKRRMLITDRVLAPGAGGCRYCPVSWSAFMLLTLDSEISECYRHAAECGCSAAQSRDSLTKQDFLDMQRRWLCLAHSYEFAERLGNLTGPSRRRNRKKSTKRRSTHQLVLIRTNRSRCIMASRERSM